METGTAQPTSNTAFALEHINKKETTIRKSNKKGTTGWLTAMCVNDFTETSSCEKKNPIDNSS